MKRQTPINIKKKYQTIILLLFFVTNTGFVFAQTVDSIKTDSSLQANMAADSLPKKVDSSAMKDFLFTQQILQKHPYFNFTTVAQAMPYAEKKKSPGKELYFYLLTGLLLVFAGFKTAFSKYFDDLMALFFKRSMKQRQLKQQVSQNSLPSLLFNIFYVVVMGFYLALMISEFGNTKIPFWQFLIYCTAFITVTYITKYLVLKLAGWMFQLKHLTESYIFIVFLVNKIIGIILLPVIVLVALGNIELKTIILTLSWVALAGLFIYRFVQAFGLLRKQRAISKFHFVLYLLAFEILPVMVIYKAFNHFL